MTHVKDWFVQHWQELSAALTALVCVWLTLKNKISNWPWGIVSVLLYAWVFWQAKLYANFGLNLFYFLPSSLYGWWNWAKAGPEQNDDLPVRRLSRRGNLIGLGITLLITLVIGAPISYYTQDPNPYADALLTGLSIMAQWMQAKKWLENWWYWIAADVIFAVYLFPVQHLYFSMALYFLFLMIAIQGALAWRKLAAPEFVDA
jgi:nicotinamide mononucleotide transporter